MGNDKQQRRNKRQNDRRREQRIECYEHMAQEAVGQVLKSVKVKPDPKFRGFQPFPQSMLSGLVMSCKVEIKNNGEEPYTTTVAIPLNQPDEMEFNRVQKGIKQI